MHRGGADSEADAAFCDTCGAALATTCASCGTSAKPGAKFCRKCGQTLGGGSPGHLAATVDTRTRRPQAVRLA